MQIHADSHLDHGLSEAQVAHLLERFKDRAGFFKETVELPGELGTVPCALYGPAMGDPPVTDGETEAAQRGTRAHRSRCVQRPTRDVRTVFVVAGPHDGLPCVLYTAYGGAEAPQEVGELELAWEKLAAVQPRTEEVCAQMDALRPKLEASRRFWSEHGLALAPTS